MPAGLQCFNPNGSLSLEISDRVCRVLTTVFIPTTTSGSIAVAGLTEGTPLLAAVQKNESKAGPTLGTSGGSVTWNYGSTPTADRDGTLSVRVMVF